MLAAAPMGSAALGKTAAAPPQLDRTAARSGAAAAEETDVSLKVCYDNNQYTCEIPVSENDAPVSIEKGIDCLLVAFESDRWFCLRGNVATEIYMDIGDLGLGSMH